MRKEVPAGVLELLKVPGLRPDKVLKLYQTLCLASLSALAKAARSDRISASLQTKILSNLAIAEGGENRLHIHRAFALIERAKIRLAAVPQTSHALLRQRIGCRPLDRGPGKTRKRC